MGLLLATGTQIGPYRILERVGEGGMGEVYRARDSRLDRIVALKVLAPEVAADSDLRQRFEREARIISQLPHPHICTVFDVGREGGLEYLVMEYLEGETLSQRLTHGPLPLARCLRIGVEIADALEQAHAHGVIHRDLKPANVMLTPSGSKLLDFGLAKVEHREYDPELDITRTLGPKTEAGRTLGTVSYMSPEQAEGKPVDARSDIFSFGALLYEAVTGRKAFEGGSQISILSSILRSEPKPVTEVAPRVPAGVARILERCLRKDPARRYQHSGDLRLALEEAEEDLRREPPTDHLRRPPVAPAAPQRLPWIIAGAAVVLALITSIWQLGRSHGGSEPPYNALRQITMDGGLAQDPAISPDGKLIVFASDRSGDGNLDLWLKQVEGRSAIRLTFDPADDYEPAFSPDGTQVAFRSERGGGGIYVMPAFGGDAHLISSEGHNPRYSPDGTQLAFSSTRAGLDVMTPGRLVVAAVAGGSARQIQPGFRSAESPVWIDNDRLLFYGSYGDERGDWYVTDLGQEPASPLHMDELQRRLGIRFEIAGAWNAATSELILPGRSHDAVNLWAVRLYPRGWKARDARRLTFGSDHQLWPSTSASGEIAFTSHSSRMSVWETRLSGGTPGMAGTPGRGGTREQGTASAPSPPAAPRQLTAAAAGTFYPTLSPDGRYVAFCTDRSGIREVWIHDTESGEEHTVSAPSGAAQWPVFTSSNRLFYAAEPGQRAWSFFATSTKGGLAEKVCDACGRLDDVTPDERWVLYHRSGQRSQGYVLDRQTRRSAEILTDPAVDFYQIHFSADGQWIVFLVKTTSRESQIYAAPFRGLEPIPRSSWVTLTAGTTSDDKPRLSEDRSRLYFVADRDGFLCIYEQRLDPATMKPVGMPQPVQHFHNARRSMSAVGRPLLEISVAGNKLIYNLQEVSGEIWLARQEREAQRSR
jgi:eukaryotic-like serine/threonine-protein kinase